MDDDRFILVPITVSILDVRDHMGSVDENTVPTADELRYMADLTYKLVPVSQALQEYAKLLVGKPVLN